MEWDRQRRGDTNVERAERDNEHHRNTQQSEATVRVVHDIGAFADAAQCSGCAGDGRSRFAGAARRSGTGSVVGVSWLDNQPDPELYVYGAADIAWYVLMALALAAVLAWRSIPGVATSRVLAILLAGVPILIVGRYLIDRYLW